MNTKTKNPPAADEATAASLATSAASSAAADAVASDVKVAYHDGPPALGYFGRRWQRGEAQTIPAADWQSMQARSDFAPFDFRVVA